MYAQAQVSGLAEQYLKVTSWHYRTF